MGNPTTGQRIRKIHKKNAPDIIFLCETKNPTDMIRKELQWFNSDKFIAVPPQTPGSGGLFLTWRQDIELTVISSTKNFIDTSISYKGKEFHATFVYGEPDHTKRQEVWNDITNLQKNSEDPWFLIGDFNEIVDNSEKCGGSIRAEGTFVAFRSFLSSNDLFDLKHSGPFLSWRGQRHSHLVRCRLDRAISNSNWTELYPACRSQYLKFEGSDHRPLLSFFDTTRKRGNKLFRFDRRLKENPEIKQLINEVWNGSHNMPVEDRLSMCRKAICIWSKTHHENSGKALEVLKQQLEDAMTAPVSNEELIRELNKKLLHLYKAEEEFWKQRSRQMWLTLGDANTGFFHATTKGRKAKNRMSVLENEEGVPFYEEEQISEVICKYYSSLFTSSHVDGSQTVEKALRPCVSREQNEKLTAIPTMEEIKAATFAIHPDKAPGPDGFSACFFQANWETVGPAVTEEVQSFFITGHLAQQVNNTVVRLIPKSTTAKRIEEYRPIALCNVFYKIISKLLSLRLKPVLASIISENQSAFIPGTAIADNVLITHEVLHFLKISKAKKKCTMAVKTDMSKAYDRVEWNFVSTVLKRLGFDEVWTNWIMQCITTVQYSYLVNDSVYGRVKPYRGIRQGDPLSPYIFILCGEVLTGLCKKAARDGTLQGIRVARACPRVNHLLFADDTMFFCQANRTSCEKLAQILSEYGKVSGQKINRAKSSITFSSKAPLETMDAAKTILGISKVGGLGKYLGLPEHFGRRKRDLFTSIVDRIRQRSLSWSTRFLSRVEKLTLLKAVLAAIPTYTMSCFQIPMSLCKRIQSVLTRFWWDGAEGKKKMCWVSWERMTAPKALGGLGLRDIQLFNQALLAKVAWRIVTTPDCLLARVLKGKYCQRAGFLDTNLPSSCSHGWRSILFGRDLLKENLGKAIGNGQTTKLWKDSWISLDEDVKSFGPNKEENMDLMVSDLLTTDLQWNTGRIKEILPALCEKILCIQPSRSGAEDLVVWQPSPTGIYSTRSGYFTAYTKSQYQPRSMEGTFTWQRDVWNNTCSPKLRLFLWSIVNDALPIGENLQKRGMVSAINCPRCNEKETKMHIFFTCPFAKKVWNLIPLSRAVHIAAGMKFTEALTRFREAICLPPTGIVGAILPWVIWAIWTSRNALIFEN